MKIEILLKSPDAINEAMREYNISQDEAEMLYETHLSKWFRWGEILTVILDTDTGEMTVKAVKSN